MSYKIKLGSFSKHANSTKQPTTTSWAEYDVTLKNGCDLLDPEVTLNISEATVAGYNYATMFGKYFFIADKYMLRENLCVLQLRHDPMATYKSAIGGTSMYILRSSASSNGNIMDKMYPMNGTVTKSRYTISSGSTNPFTGGYYVLNVMGMQTGTSTLFQFTPSQFSTLVNNLMAIADGFDLSDIIDQIKVSVFKPMDYINSVMWFPEAFTGTAVSASNFYIGYWPGNVACTQITNPIKVLSAGFSFTPTIAKHPQAASRGNYLNFAPYTEYNLVFPPFGIIPIDTTQVKTDTYLSLNLHVDALTGMGILRGYTVESGDNTVFEVSAQYGVQLPLLGNGLTGSFAGMLSNATGIIGGIATGSLGIGAALAGATSLGIGGIEDAIIGSTSTIGSNGSIVAHSLPKYLDARFFGVVNDDNAHNGRPYCQVTTPATLTGYMIASKGEVTITGSISEQNEINAYMESGFFYE